MQFEIDIGKLENKEISDIMDECVSELIGRAKNKTTNNPEKKPDKQEEPSTSNRQDIENFIKETYHSHCKKEIIKLARAKGLKITNNQIAYIANKLHLCRGWKRNKLAPTLHPANVIDDDE